MTKMLRRIETHPPKGLLFDVFGTCTEWRNAVARELSARAHSVDPRAAESISASRWSDLVVDWRRSYYEYCHSFKPGETQWMDIDAFHLESFRALLKQYQLESLWSEQDVRDISLVWHRLDGRADAGSGIRALNALGIQTGSLSNGNMSLLQDLSKHADLPFTKLVSAEGARTQDGHHAYKPHPSVYQYGCRQLGLEPSECALVAAHLGDLRAAKEQGLFVIYVERPDEEAWSKDEIAKARAEGWVDLWVEESPPGPGFVEVAKRFAGWKEKASST